MTKDDDRFGEAIIGKFDLRTSKRSALDKKALENISEA